MSQAGTPSVEELTYYHGIGPVNAARITEQTGLTTAREFAELYTTTDARRLEGILPKTDLYRFHQQLLELAPEIDDNELYSWPSKPPVFTAMVFIRHYGLDYHYDDGSFGGARKNLRIIPEDVNWDNGGIINASCTVAFIWDTEAWFEANPEMHWMNELTDPLTELAPVEEDSLIIRAKRDEGEQFYLSRDLLLTARTMFGIDPFVAPHRVMARPNSTYPVSVVSPVNNDFSLLIAPRIFEEDE